MSLDTMWKLDEIKCETCDAGGHTCRVTGGSLDYGAHTSQYACPRCVGEVLAVIRTEHPDAAVFPLPGRNHQPTLTEPLGVQS